MQAIFANENRNFKSGGKEISETKIVWHKFSKLLVAKCFQIYT